MVIIHRQAVIAPGRLLEALGFAREVDAHVSGLLPDSRGGRVGTELGGTLVTVHWFREFDDLAALERGMDALMSDETYLGFVSKAAGLFLPGTSEDEVIRTF